MATNPFAKYKESGKESKAEERKEPKGLQRHEKSKGMEPKGHGAAHGKAKKKPC